MLLLFFSLLLISSLASSQTTDIPKLKETVQRRINTYLDKNKKLGDFYAITDEGFELFASPEKKLKKEHECIFEWYDLSCLFDYINSPDPIAKLKKLEISRKNANVLDRAYCRNRPVPPPPADKPLQGKRIALDPGHTAGTLESGKIEQKFIHIPTDSIHHINQDVELVEGHLTLGTALQLKKKLEDAGATVLMTHSAPDETAFGISFETWCKTSLKHALDSLLGCKSISKEQYQVYSTTKDKRKLFRDIFRDIELKKRAELINAFKPDITIIIHYNVDEKNTDWKKLSEKNYVMTFIGGSMLPSELHKQENRIEFLRLALTDDLEKSELLSSKMVSSFSSVLNIPIAEKNDANYLRDNCLATNSKGVYCRNLILTRIIHGPLVYGETIYQDNRTECYRLMQEDDEISGVKVSPRVKQVADAYYQGILNYFQKP